MLRFLVHKEWTSVSKLWSAPKFVTCSCRKGPGRDAADTQALSLEKLKRTWFHVRMRWLGTRADQQSLLPRLRSRSWRPSPSLPPLPPATPKTPGRAKRPPTPPGTCGRPGTKRPSQTLSGSVTFMGKDTEGCWGDPEGTVVCHRSRWGCGCSCLGPRTHLASGPLFCCGRLTRRPRTACLSSS